MVVVVVVGGGRLCSQVQVRFPVSDWTVGTARYGRLSAGWL